MRMADCIISGVDVDIALLKRVMSMLLEFFLFPLFVYYVFWIEWLTQGSRLGIMT